MSKENKKRFARRDVLKATATSSALVAGGVGTGAAQQGRGPENGGGSRGPPEDRDPENGGGGSPDDRGPDRVTGGSVLTLSEPSSETFTVEGTVDGSTDPDSPDSTITYYSGCSAAEAIEETPNEEAGSANKDYQGYTTATGEVIYVHEKRPFNEGTYNVVEYEECGTYEGQTVYKVGLEPAEEGGGGGEEP